MDDYWFLRAALVHPMRTRNASEARLFVIPSLHNVYDMRAYFKLYDLCIENLCNEELMIQAAQQVTSSPWFHQHPEAHLAVVDHFAHRKKLVEQSHASRLSKYAVSIFQYSVRRQSHK